MFRSSFFLYIQLFSDRVSPVQIRKHQDHQNRTQQLLINVQLKLPEVFKLNYSDMTRVQSLLSHFTTTIVF